MRDDEVNTVLAALADPTRREIVEILSDGRDRSLAEITDKFAMSRQAVAKHLGILNSAGVVISTRRGRDRSNRLQPDALEPLRDWLKRYSRFCDDRLLALKRQVEEEDSP